MADDHAPDPGKPRLSVAAAFVAAKGGTVVMGFLTGGPLARSQEVVIQPSGTRATIRNLRSDSREVGMVLPGRWVIASLADFDPRLGSVSPVAARGNVLTIAGLGGPTDTVDVMLEQSLWLASATPSHEPSRNSGGEPPHSIRFAASAAHPVRAKRMECVRFTGAFRFMADEQVRKEQVTRPEPPLEDRARVRVLAGSCDLAATVFLHGGRTPGTGQSRLAQLRFEAHAFMFADDRLLLCDRSGQVLLGTGRVLDPDGDRKHWQQKAQLALLEARAAAPAGPAGAAVWVQSALTRHGMVEREGFLAASSFHAEEIRSALEQLAVDGRAVLTPALAADNLVWGDLVARAAQIVDHVHRLHPEWVGLPLRDLHAELEDQLPLPGAFEAILAALDATGFIHDSRIIRRASHRALLPAHLEAAGAWLRRMLAEKPLEPPSRKDLTPNADAARALQFLIETGEAVAVGPGQVLDARAYQQAVGEIVQCLRLRGQATMSELRQQLGCTRRILIPLCEKLDQEGITRREGDVRRLRAPGLPGHGAGSTEIPNRL